MDGLSIDLPAWAQVTLTVGGFLGTAFAAFIGYTRKWPQKFDTPNKDAVVISAAFADSKVIAELKSSVNTFSEQVGQLVQAVEAGRQERIRHTGVLEAHDAALRAHCRALEENTHATNRMARALEDRR